MTEQRQRQITTLIPDLVLHVHLLGGHYRTPEDRRRDVFTRRYVFEALGNGRTYLEPFDLRGPRKQRDGFRITSSSTWDELFERAVTYLLAEEPPDAC
jgi:hypothetical protein